MSFFLTVPQKNVAIIERFGKFNRILQPGLQFKIPLAERVPYLLSLKEEVYDIDLQTAITRDNVKIGVSTVLYYKITDPVKACYEVKNPVNALEQLAKVAMRSEIGRIDLDRTFEERDNLNNRIRMTLNDTC
jgi:regulator of protease activity HflC (stomatin/prohibitin superfamily)